MNFFCQSMHCFDTYWRKIKPRYFFKHIYSHLTFSGNENAFKLYYREGYDYDLFYVFSRRFTPKNLKKIKYANQQLRDVSRKKELFIRFTEVPKSEYAIKLINMVFDDVKINLYQLYDIEFLPRSACYNKIKLNIWDLQDADIFIFIETVINLGVKEIELKKCPEAKKILAFLGDNITWHTIQEIILIKFEFQ